MKCDECGQEVEDILCPDCMFEREEDNSWKDELIGKMLELCKQAESDLFVFISDYLDLDIETSECGQAETTRKLQKIIAKVETLKSQGRL